MLQDLRSAFVLAALVAASPSLGCSVPAQPSPGASAQPQAQAQAPAADRQNAQRVQALHDAMRKLWEDHITYTRTYIISALGGLEDADKTAERLLRNQDDIGAAVATYYGDDAGKKLASLLRDHILIAADIVKAAKAGDDAKVTDGQTRWKANADDLASFLSGANPNWPKADLQAMLYKHLEYTTTEVVSRLKKDWAADAMAYDQGHEHMLMFADHLTAGIVKQFPDKFAP